jgi:Hg(II)-responsive transcriptional regulator
MKIGTVAKESGIGIETIRYYEREGLIAEPPRAGKYREYPEDTVLRLSFIRHAKDLGFSLKEIRELLTLRAKPKGKCASVRRRAIEKIEDVDKKISQLQGIKVALQSLVNQCDAEKPTSECPILEAFEQQGV